MDIVRFDFGEKRSGGLVPLRWMNDERANIRAN